MNLMVDWLMDINWKGIGLTTALLLLLSACNTTKYLTEGEQLLTEQSVKLLDSKKLPNKGTIIYELETLTKQNPNNNFLLLFPREYFYLSNNKPKDTTGLDRFLRSTIGQAPSIYDNSLSIQTTASMESYLKYKGFFEAEVYHETNPVSDKKIAVTYYAKPGKQTIINEVHFASPLPDIDTLLQEIASESLLKKGNPLDLNLYSQEKERIGRYFRNKGYASLYSNAFDQLEVDTFQQPGLADLYINILPPKNAESHTKYKIGSVTIYADYKAGIGSPKATLPPIDTFVKGTRFIYQDGVISVEPEILLDNIFLKPGDYYSKSNFDKSNKQLGGLGIFRFVRINQLNDIDKADVINYVVQLTPNDKMELGLSLDLSYTNRKVASVGTNANHLIGIGITPSFKNRNTFGEAELLVINPRAGVEINPAYKVNRSELFNTIDLGIESSLYLPRFRDYLSTYKWLYNKSKGLLSDRFYNAMRDEATTRFNLGAEYLLIQDFYAYTQLNSRFGYNMNISSTTRYTIDHAAVDLFIPRTEPRWDTTLMQNPFLQRSFGEQYFVSALFRGLEYQRQGRPNRRNQSIDFLVNLETAGGEIYLANQLYNALSKNDTEFRPTKDATYAQYFRARFDIRYLKKHSERNNLAARLIFAIARPFGNATAVPYVKQFAVGGSNSMRAWDLRGLGPGGYVDDLSLLSRGERGNQLLYQTGDLQLEFNVEYRYKLFWQIHGAFFLDIGNVWTVQEEANGRCGSQFLFRSRTRDCNGESFNHQAFYRQLAIGGGSGIRLDLSYFILRLDAALPLRYNAPRTRPEGNIPERLYWNNFDKLRINWQLGLGYPF